MPRFVIESAELGEEAAGQVRAMAARLFPELVIEPMTASIAGSDGCEGVTRVTRWTCRAPSAAHVRRWAIATGVDVVDVSEVER